MWWRPGAGMSCRELTDRFPTSPPVLAAIFSTLSLPTWDREKLLNRIALPGGIILPKPPLRKIKMAAQPLNCDNPSLVQNRYAYITCE